MDGRAKSEPDKKEDLCTSTDPSVGTTCMFGQKDRGRTFTETLIVLAVSQRQIKSADV